MYFSFARRRLGALIIASFASTTLYADSGHGLAVAGEVMGGVLIAIGAVSMAADSAACASGSTCWKIPLDLAEMIGGGIALLNNSSTASLTTDNVGNLGSYSTNLATISGGDGSGSGSNANIADKCAQAAPICTCTGTDTCVPHIDLPPLDTLQGQLSSGYALNQGGDPNGPSLQDALNDLATNYPKAQEAAAAFNQAALAGAFDGSGTENIAANPDAATNDSNEALAHLATSIAAATGTSNASSGDSMDLTKLMEKAKAERGDAEVPKVNGFDLEDKTGRTLSIWERVSLAIRGAHNRDILMAKVELTRKEVAKQKKNLASAKVSPLKD